MGLAGTSGDFYFAGKDFFWGVAVFCGRAWATGLAVSLLCAGAASASTSTPAPQAAVEAALQHELAAATGPVVAIATVDEAESQETAGRLQDLGLTVLGFRHLPFLAVRGTPDQLRAAAGTAGVQRLSANSPIEYAMEHTREAAGVDAVQATGLTGGGVGIAVVDTGIDGSHPDFAGAIRENVKVLADDDTVWDFARAAGVAKPGAVPDVGALMVPAENTDLNSGHGTHVAGTAAGRGTASDGRHRGVAPGAHLLGVGIGDGSAVLWPLAAFDHVLERHAALNIQVVNASFVGPESAFFRYDPDAPMQVATRALFDAGVAVVFAGGNYGPGQDTMNVFSVWPWVLAVGNACIPTKPLAFEFCDRTSADGTVALNDSSSRGVPGHDLRHPDLVAPGSFVMSARPTTPGMHYSYSHWELYGDCSYQPARDFLRYRCMSGTSVAAPHVAGVLALMEQAAGRDLTPAELFELVTTSARPLPPLETWEVGAGMLDAVAAVRAAHELTAP